MNASPQNSASSSDLFAGIDVQNGQIIFDQEVIAPGAPHNDNGGGYESKITADTLKRWYSSERMHRHVVKILGWVGRWRGYQSLQVDPNDEDFRAGVEVLHKRLAGTTFAALIERFGSDAVEDVIICFMAFSPVAASFGAELVEKNKAANLERQVERETQSNEQ